MPAPKWSNHLDRTATASSSRKISRAAPVLLESFLSSGSTTGTSARKLEVSRIQAFQLPISTFEAEKFEVMKSLQFHKVFHHTKPDLTGGHYMTPTQTNVLFFGENPSNWEILQILPDICCLYDFPPQSWQYVNDPRALANPIPLAPTAKMLGTPWVKIWIKSFRRRKVLRKSG